MAADDFRYHVARKAAEAIAHRKVALEACKALEQAELAANKARGALNDTEAQLRSLANGIPGGFAVVVGDVVVGISSRSVSYNEALWAEPVEGA